MGLIALVVLMTLAVLVVMTSDNTRDCGGSGHFGGLGGSDGPWKPGRHDDPGARAVALMAPMGLMTLAVLIVITSDGPVIVEGQVTLVILVDPAAPGGPVVTMVMVVAQ